MLELQDRQAPEQAANVGMPAGNTPAPASTERPAEAKSTALVDYSKKYWWVGVVVMPILLLILNKVWGSGDPVKPSPSVSIDARDYSQTVQNVQNNIQQFLGQPIDDDDAKRMLQLLNNRWHEVLTGVAVVRVGGESRVAYETTRVRFAEMSDHEIHWYVSTGEARGKAGAYGIQGAAGLFIKEISGDYFNIVGLPIRLVYELIKD